jgi:pyruvate,water dikinase
MAEELILPLDDTRANLMVAGGKGASLARLAAAGLPVPGGFHVTTAAYRLFVARNGLQEPIMRALATVDVDQPASLKATSDYITDLMNQAQLPDDIAYQIAQAYEELPGINPAVAVRSSATAEDLPELSFAGQQETYLNIQGIAALLEMVCNCWASLWTGRAIAYRARHGVDSERLSLAVVVQLMVPAEAAGILFTANPLNGRHDQMLINAAWGLGEAIVGGLVTPDTLTVDKDSGRVLERQVADKTVMTVGLDGGIETRQVPETIRRSPVLDDEQVAELTHLGCHIETLYECPVDVEWTLEGGQLSIVQARPITALPEPEATPPDDWPRPQPKGRYIRTSIIDLMPDPLSPLFGSMGLTALNQGLIRLTAKIARSDTPWPDDTLQTINDFCYMKLHFTRGQWFWMIFRLGPAFPRMVREGVSWWQDEARPVYVQTIARWQDKDRDELTPTELLAACDEILYAAADHLGSLMAGTMGISAGSEGLFTKIYDKLVKRSDDPWAPAFLMGYDSIPIKAEKSLFDLATWARGRVDLAEYILGAPSARLAAEMQDDQSPAGIDPETWSEFKDRLESHLNKFGHIIFDLDFARPLPLDDPVPMLETCKMYLRGKGADPHQRQRLLADTRTAAAEEALGRLRGLRKWLFCKSLSLAQSRAQVREDGLADIGLGYPLLRNLLLELGQRLVRVGVLGKPDDVFWLQEVEVHEAADDLERGQLPEAMFERVTQRKALWRAEKRVTPPPKVPIDAKYLGMSGDAFLPTHEVNDGGSILKGVGASPGRVTAAACVLHGPEDFEIMQPGEVLVAGITTPAWTPLFAMASAVVTDVGGPLSHGSIVAREYGIPAVLGTGTATKRIAQGDLITVDGDVGLVYLPESEAA